MWRIFNIILIFLSLCSLSVTHGILENLNEWKAEVLGEIDELSRDSTLSNESHSHTLNAEEVQNLEQKLWKFYQKLVAKLGPIRQDTECKELSAKFERRIEWPLIIGMGICMKVKTAVEKSEFEPENTGLEKYEPRKRLEKPESSKFEKSEPSVSEIPSCDRPGQREVVFVGQKARKISQILHELRTDLNTFVVEMELDALEKENDKNAGKLCTEQQFKDVLARIEHLTDTLRTGGDNVPCHFSLEPFESATMWMNMKLQNRKLDVHGGLHAISWESIGQTLSIMLIEARLDSLDRETKAKLDPDRLDLDPLEQFERAFGQEFKQIRARIQKLDRRGTRKHLEDELETLVVTAQGRADTLKSAIIERLPYFLY